MLRSAEARAHLDGTRGELFEILTDYESYPRWVPGLDSCHVLSREGDVSVAEMRAARWSDVSATVELIRSRPGEVELRRIDSLDPFALTGRFQLGATDRGAGGGSTPVTLELRLDTPLFAFGIRRRMREQLQATLDALGGRRRHLASRPGTAPERHKILEVRPVAGGLEVWYLGETYLLPRAGKDTP